jgi:hypothetical protein
MRRDNGQTIPFNTEVAHTRAGHLLSYGGGEFPESRMVAHLHDEPHSFSGGFALRRFCLPHAQQNSFTVRFRSKQGLENVHASAVA